MAKTYGKRSAYATRLLHDEQDVTVSCAQGEVGRVFEGIADYQVEEIDFSAIPRTRTQIMLNLANPDAALRWWRMPADGVGLARMEFVISNHIRIHPMALAHFDDLKDADAARTRALTAYKDFLALWKDADPNIPVLQQAKFEYAKLL